MAAISGIFHKPEGPLYNQPSPKEGTPVFLGVSQRFLILHVAFANGWTTVEVLAGPGEAQRPGRDTTLSPRSTPPAAPDGAGLQPWRAPGGPSSHTFACPPEPRCPWNSQAGGRGAHPLSGPKPTDSF